VNVIPGEVRIETHVRGKTLQAILDAERRVDRALRAGALALGAKVEIQTLPGYMPLDCQREMGDLFRENAAALFGERHVTWIGHKTGSTDMGDLSQIMPVLQPYMGGARGSASHAPDYEIVDQELAYVAPAKMLAAMGVDLLWGDAGTAQAILESARPPMTRERYLALQRSLARREVYEA
jgi:metal-dependent amidase/aminoacylase/carboxypeptidase family protein